MSKLEVWTNDVDTVVVPDRADIESVIAEHCGYTFEQEGMSLDDWSRVPDDQPITIRNVHDRGWDDKLTMTAGEWAKREGRCFLCSTEW